MQQRVLSTTVDPELVIDVKGDLRLIGGDLNEVYAEGDDPLELSADASGSQVSLRCTGNCTARVPRHARITLQHIGGDARIKDLAADLTINDVGGDLVLRQTAGVRVGHVGGDVSAKKIGGALVLAGAGGDVSARGVEGGFSSGVAGGDLYLRDVLGEANGQAGGDAILNLAFAPGKAYAFIAGGDIICRVAPETSARIVIQCNGEVSVDAPNAHVEGHDGQQVITLRAGAASVSLQSRGDVSISDITTDSSGVAESGDDFGERLAEEIESKIAARMAEVERELNAQFGHLNLNLSGLGRLDAERIAAKARRAAEAARRKSEAHQRKMEAAHRKAERMAERASRRRTWGNLGSVGSFGGRSSPSAPSAPTPPVEPVSDEERLTVLRLLEQGKISVADAEKLLAALEGKG